MVNILAIESSCDETAAAVVSDGRLVRSNIIASQAELHGQYGGVVPEIASRSHLQAIVPVVEEALSAASLGFSQIGAVAVTSGPGLAGALLVGVSYAKALAMALDVPLIAVHHWQGHLSAVFLEHEVEFPFLALVVSGGHSGLVEAVSHGEYRLLGQSLDDAAGEAFDKIARVLGLGYPGGPALERAAQNGAPDAHNFPRAWLAPDSFDFSFSGLKSAVLNHLNRLRMSGHFLSEKEIADIAASAQEAICDVLSAKAIDAAGKLGLKTVAVVGGVAANARLRQLLRQRAGNVRVIWPSPLFCTDNAAMIGVAAWHKWQKGEFSSLALNADPREKLYSVI
ncbi:MAG: tRNA (adenosine(37)-N6)-threonylcarbamoyltransferase complex transferase subunit TsaD [Clostridiales bacterium]|nr:tRNA (adenosine(37)-N6)-threonylcarbamoyltransferase complex transferase subunit TsaD [Clostridiales bacterium]